ncbi:MAG: photosystem II protein PsbQ [Gloeotrichia echinulata IR180]|jgi:photosystem II protein PsbQ|nr:photosystem II protein PsbQ [Gloeotrichia echinulata DEX184]
MARQRSVFSLILVLLATFLISCSGASVAVAPPTYTAQQVAKIQEYVTPIEAVRDRSPELQQLIETKDWINVGNFIHGPITEAKLAISYITPNLLPKDQPAAREISRDFLKHLVKIDQGATQANSQLALSNYQAAFADLDKFLELLPKTSSQSEAS